MFLILFNYFEVSSFVLNFKNHNKEQKDKCKCNQEEKRIIFCVAEYIQMDMAKVCLQTRKYNEKK